MTTLERLEQLELRVEELEREVEQLSKIVAEALERGFVADGSGAVRERPLRSAEAMFNEHNAKRKRLLS